MDTASYPVDSALRMGVTFHPPTEHGEVLRGDREGFHMRRAGFFGALFAAAALVLVTIAGSTGDSQPHDSIQQIQAANGPCSTGC